MPINTLQQQAFNNAENFRSQVYTEVKRQALGYSDDLEATDGDRQLLASVIKYPESFYFPQTIVADYDWTATFDPWSADPTSTGGAIQTFVTKHFGLLTGYYPPAA